ncbi:MAG: NBR1-Ig-like domain-containing protein, partial [Anaerolineae bacterium]|nr:NBR1-Ig-like domain-containing protein [Anaerolineae bacterium]
GLEGSVRSITYLEGVPTYRLEYAGADGSIRTVWLGSGGLLGRKLEWARRYHLGGVAVEGLLDPGNAAGVSEAVAAYRSGGGAAGGALPEVVWTVTSPEATVDRQVAPLTQPDYTWVVLAAEGEYKVQATIAGFDHGSVPIVVARPQPEPTPVITPTGSITGSQETTTPPVTQPVGGGETPAECLDARWVKDVTVPDNTRFEKGKEFDKTWLVRNTGTCAWPEDTVLAFVSGAKLDAPDSVPVGAVEPGKEVEVTVKMKAPSEDGNYTGVWRMKTTQGPFGGNLTVVIVVGEGTTAMPVVAPVSSGGFELGGHVRDLSHPYANLMHHAGMTWSKVQVHYAQDATGIIQAAHANGFKIQLSALGKPSMVVEPGFEQKFADWVASLARAGADAIEVWNEPNIDREWQIGYISPQAYTKLLCTAYNAIKKANPKTAVISAAPAPTGYFGGCSPNGCDDKPWMEGLFNAGAANCMDYIGAHHNAGATPPSATSGHPGDNGSRHHSWYFLPQTQLYYNIFRGTRKLFYTEMGYASQEGVPPFSDAFGWARGTNNAQQAAWLAEAVQLSIQTGMVRCIIVWNIDFVRYGYDPQDGYAIIRPDGSCPACEALHKILGTR